MGTVTLVFGDTHIGGSTALALNEYCYETGEYVNDEPVTIPFVASRSQNWLYDCFQEMWKYTKKLAGKKHRIVCVHVGDVVDGNHHHTVQAIPILEAQEDMAVEILKPLVNGSDAFHIFRGTEAHAGEIAQSESRIAKELGVPCWWEETLDIDGVLCAFQHHGSVGRRPWTSSAASMAIKARNTALEMKNPVPRYLFYGHNHIVDDSGEKVMGTRAVALSAWQLRTAYGYKVSPGTRSDIGGAIILPNGELDLSRLRYMGAAVQKRIIKV